MNLYLLRHAIAEDLGAGGHWDDAARKLTREGERKMRAIAKGMVELDLKMDLILTSPYARAHQTATLVARELKGARLELCELLRPGGSMHQLVHWLEDPPHSANETLLVGHEPYLSELAALLVFGKATEALQMKKGGLCKIRIGKLHDGKCGVLEWLLTPKQLRSFA